MSESGKGIETFIKITGAILLLLFIFGDDNTKIGVLYAPMGIGIVLVIYVGLKKKIKQDREERIYQKKSLVEKNYPDAYRIYKINSVCNEKKWTDDETKKFMSVPDAQWAIWQKEEDDRREALRVEKMRILSEVSHLEQEAPRGLKYWLKKNNKEATWVGGDFDKVGFQIEKDIKIVLKHSEEIEKLELFCQNKENEETWSKEQIVFSQSVRKLVDGVLKGMGCFTYYAPVSHIDEEGDTFESSQQFRQLFFHSFCKDGKLDYTFFPNSIKLRNYLMGEPSSADWIPLDRRWYYYKIDGALKALREEYENVAVLIYNDELINQSMDELVSRVLGNEVTSQLREQDKLFADIILPWSAPLEYEKKVSIYNYSDIRSDISVLQNKKLIVITNQIPTIEIISFTQQLWDRRPESRPCICFLSFFKEHSTEEMQSLIDKKNNAIKEEEKKKRKEQELTDSIPSKVNDWEIISSANIRIKYLLDYYPTTVEFEADDDEWDDRWTVWHFKNDPEKTPEQAHQRVLNRVIPEFVGILKETFGAESLKYLTLVCIPASTEEKNNARYKEFSERLCQETEMENGFEHTHVTVSREARHNGGEEGVVNYSFDDSFFNGKRVILLDDIITKGNSMRIAKAKLEKLGAQVICGLSVGKTRHERRNGHPDMDEE